MKKIMLLQITNQMHCQSNLINNNISRGTGNNFASKIKINSPKTEKSSHLGKDYKIGNFGKTNNNKLNDDNFDDVSPKDLGFDDEDIFDDNDEDWNF